MSRSRRLFTFDVFRFRKARAEMREELEFHLEARVARLVACGMTAEQAHAEAHRRFGGSFNDTQAQLEQSAQRKERRTNMRERWHDFTDDVRYAFRGLLRNKGFAAIAILTLAVGIGANTSMYSAVDALLLRSLPYREPSRLMDIVQFSPDEGPTQWPVPRYVYFRDAQQVYSSLAIHKVSPTTITGDNPVRTSVEEVSPAYLATLGIAPVRGHDFSRDELTTGAPKVTIISDALWQRQFQADPAIVGKTLSLDNERWEIIGVLPPNFRGLSGRADALVNLNARSASELNQVWNLEFSMIGRLKPTITPAQAASDASLLGGRMNALFPANQGTFTSSKKPELWTAEARPLDSIRVGSALRRSLLVLFGAVALVLLIACVNLANLLIARALSRKQEIAVRLAIGAARGRLIRMLVTESLLLALLGGVASLLVAYAGTRILSAINPQETLRVQGLSGGIGAVGFEDVKLDGQALAFTFAVTVFVGIIFGLMPAVRATRGNLTDDLRDGSTGSGSGKRAGVSRRALVVVEIAMALVLLAGSGLMLRSLANLLAVNPGFDATNVLTLRLSVPTGTLAPDSMPGFYSQLQTEIAALPGVENVALADCAPLSNGCNGTIMTFADRPKTVGGNAVVGVHWVSPSWFGTMHVPLKRGRMLTDDDKLETSKVILINEAAAKEYFPGEDPIGKRVAVYQGGFDKGAEVVGIVADVRYGTVDSTARPDVYISYGQARISRMMIFVRTKGDPLSLVPAVRSLVHKAAPRTPVYDIQPMSARVATASAQARFSAILLGLFAAVALVLAMTGIYGVMAFGVAQRTRELGIRVALGADRNSVLSLILREGAALAAVGIAIGLVVALSFARVLQSLLFEITATDTATYAAMVLVLGTGVLLASLIPARRATKVDPMIAMRNG